MTVSLFSVVVGDNDPTRLEAYLYDHTKLVASATVGRRTAYLLRTTVNYAGEPVEDDNDMSERDSAERDSCGYLVRYQVGRLHSGLYGEQCSGFDVVEAFALLSQWLKNEIAIRV